MTDTQRHLDQLAEIRAMMERSSRFISLSGLSGVWAGCCALVGAALVYDYLGAAPFSSDATYYEQAIRAGTWGLGYRAAFILIGVATLITALAGGIFFTSRKAKRQGMRVWDATSRRLLYALAVPLVAGGVFCLALLHWGFPGFVAPATLVFYGLGLVNGGKYTVRDIEYLGLLEIGLGLIAMFRLGNGLEFWALGFGVLHIIYGAWMYVKYDK